MNARPFIQSARALIAASGLIAASTIMASAADVPVALGASATVPLANYYLAPPTGLASLGGHTFDLTAGNLIQLANGQSVTFAGSYPNTTAAYLLVNTFNTYLYYDQTAVGTVVLTFSDGTTQTTTLTVGQNLREWRVGATGVVNYVAATGSGSTQVWSGTAQTSMGGGAAVIDMLTIPVTVAAGAPQKTLTGIAVNDTNTFGALHIDLAGITVADAATTPTPTPTPGSGCTKTNHDDKHKVHADKHTPQCDKAKSEKDDQETTDHATSSDDSGGDD